jgi:hypothetical protein
MFRLMKKYILIPVLALFLFMGASPLQDNSVKQLSVAVQVFDSYVIDSIEEIKANNKRYLVSPTAPKKVSVALIVSEGVSPNWLLVRKVSGGRSDKISRFSENQFLFEHSGPGEYEIITFADSEPFLTYFIIEGALNPEKPEEIEKPTDPSKPDYKKLKSISDKALPNSADGRARLSNAWEKVAAGNYASIKDLQIATGNARISALSMVDQQDNAWRDYLVAIDDWFKLQNLTVDQYKEALRVLVDSLKQ